MFYPLKGKQKMQNIIKDIVQNTLSSIKKTLHKKCS